MKVMVCYDGSDVAHSALEKAVEYFKGNNPEFILLTIVADSMDASMENEEIFNEMKAEQHDVLKKASEAVTSKGFEVDAILATGKPQQMILEAIEKKKPDVAVIARQRKSKFTQHFLGSVSAYLVRNAACHLLITGPDWK